MIRRSLLLSGAALAFAAGPALARPGDLDPTFGDHGRVDSHAILPDFGADGETLDGVRVLPDGRIVLLGTERCANACRDTVVTRLTASGRPDRSLSASPAGVVRVRIADDPETFGDPVHSVALRPDGGLLVTNATEIRPVAPDGSAEPPVAAPGPLAIGTVARSAYARLDRSVLRLRPTWEVDGSFAPLVLPDGLGPYPGPVVAARGALHVAGFAPDGGIALWRVATAGAAPSLAEVPLPFTTGTRVSPLQTIVAPGGRTLVVVAPDHARDVTVLAGFRADGRPDTSFGRRGIVRVAGSGEAGVDARGRIVVAAVAPAGTRVRIVVRRLAGGGSPDRAFRTRVLDLGAGYSDRARVAIDRHGRIVVAAPLGHLDGARPDVALLRLRG